MGRKRSPQPPPQPTYAALHHGNNCSGTFENFVNMECERLDCDLFIAVQAEEYREAALLLQKGGDPCWLSEDGISALHLSAGVDHKDNVEFLKSCLARRVNPNIQSYDGLTPVHIAASWGLSETLELLLLHGGDPDISDNEGVTAIEYAYRCSGPGATECIRILLDVDGVLCEHENERRTVRQNDKLEHNRGYGREELAGDSDEENDCTLMNGPLSNDNGSCEDDKQELVSDSSLYHTAEEWNNTVISFPKLHPWTISEDDSELDETILYRTENLTLDNSCADEDALNRTIPYDWKDFSCLEAETSAEASLHESLAIPPAYHALATGELVGKLRNFGDNPGPIVDSTRRVYLKRLVRLESHQAGSMDSPYKEYLPELRAQLEKRAASPEMFTEEESMCVEFSRQSLKATWREGSEKSSFNYLLLDPRVTQNLPARHRNMDPHDGFACFILSIFYVGKGKRSRPYAHLHEAVKAAKASAKLQHIQDIWAAGLGVVSLHCFQSVIPVEAYTREACMVEALGLSRLTNIKRGDYYGRASSWGQKKKRQMGVYLLKRAYKIFLSEGERQIRHQDVKGSRP